VSVWRLSASDLRRLRDDALRRKDELSAPAIGAGCANRAAALAAIAELRLEEIDDMVAAQAEALADAREAEALHPDD
jgi:hypothetical protein